MDINNRKYFSLRTATAPRYLFLLFILALLSGCSDGSDKPWSEKNTRQKTAYVKSRVDAALIKEKTVGRGDLKKELTSLVSILPDSTPEDFTPELRRALEACERKKIPDIASQIHEKLGEFGEAARYAAEDGDLTRAAQLIKKADDASPELVAEINAALLAEFREKLEGLENDFKDDKLDEAADALEEVELIAKPLELESPDRNRLLSAQLTLAQKQKNNEQLESLIESTIKYHLERNENDSGRSELLDLAKTYMAEGQFQTGHKFLLGARTDSESSPMSAGNKAYTSRLVLASKFGRNHFSEALKLASQSSAEDKARLDLYRYALKGADFSVGDTPFPFAKPVKAKEPQTYLYMYSPGPTATEFVKKMDEKSMEFDLKTSVLASKEGIKIHMKANDDRGFFLEFLSAAYRPLEKKTYLGAKSVSRSPMVPTLAYSGDTAFSEGQYIVHELDRDPENEDKIVRFAADFIGSRSGKPADLRYGKIRYNSSFE